jgi:cobalt-zinc-cadmium efflux system protein
VVSGSLALLSDALHNFSDVLSLILSYIANRLVKKKASIRRTFGYKRSEIIAAFINASSLVVVAILLIIEAIRRFQNPQEIESDLVILLSIIAILGNGFSVLLIKANSKDNMNIKSVYLHLVSDMMASIAVLVGGLLMKYYQIYWIDSLLTFAIAVYLIVMGYDLLKSSLRVLMLFTPKGIPIPQIVKDIESIESIKNVHHLHVWQLNEREIHLEAHIDFHENINLSEFDVVLKRIEILVDSKYDINHVNIQPEFNKKDSKEIIVQD